MTRNPFKPTSLRLAIACAALGLSACAVTPEALTPEQQLAEANEDRRSMFESQEPVTGAISLEEAMARAVKYNLQQRLGLMQRALEDNTLSVSNLNLLPQLAASAGWKGRDNVAGSSSESVTTGQESLEPSTSSDRSSRDANLRLSWNVLDFGVSYFSAKAQANKVLAAEEARRKVVADIIQQVREAYWQAASAERLQPEVQRALGDARNALQQARQTEQQRLIAPLESLRYQKGLLEMVRQLEVVEGELAVAKSRLASLMNLPPASQYSLVQPGESSYTQPALAYNLADLEATSMVQRPEIRSESYQARNAVLETRAAMLKLLPGANLFVGANYDSNSYLVNDNWADAGLQVSWNLFNVLAYPAVKRSGEARLQVAELRRQAMRMAVLTQVNVAWREFQRSSQVFARSNELQQVQRNILRQSESAYASQAQSRLERVRTATETVLATRTRDRAFAELQVAHGAVYQAAGLDPLPERIAGRSIAELSRSIASNAVRLDQGQGAIPAGIAAAQQAPYGVASSSAAAGTPLIAQAPMQRQVLRLDMWESLGSLRGAELVPVERVNDR
ncbi:TolC family protein [Stutzerimonas kirkiae]|uniref:TolC family protein n=1 Tax=Stutzerimonas kirkiae TaxID=2211392 RepID=A0A4V2KD85_9GAMM|nr:TolC family protein [Stutzerimonas kirkiae]TBU98051.1 TolC family protein [Stutzerimonas kirkiae]TBV02928.1 TolC family protein [Stutzerimonas kirkiae]TBV11102.1 TolC family protein [Stutzerimonas kirkiae]